jgi:NADPH-dependent glutamate synthase beta subunit-like oxidoreductase/NAD(P)H-flavin reductase
MNYALKLKNFTFEELFHSKGLSKLDNAFLEMINPELREQLLSYRQQTRTFTPIEISELLIACSQALETFLIELFDIEEAVSIAEAKSIENNPISAFKKFFVLRRAKKNLLKLEGIPSFAELNQWLLTQLNSANIKTTDPELSIALLGNQFIHDDVKYADEIEKLTQWCVRALTSEEGKKITENWVSFQIPEKVEYDNLVHFKTITEDKLQRLAADENELRYRDGFKLTDPRMNAREVQDQVNYCIYCHDHDGDFCSKGFPVKKGDPAQGLKKNPLDVTMTGCPLEEKISEMNFLKRDGYTLASLAMVMVDNPMCPATGHRICNDCMKACIYQKQDPVNVPQIETRVLTDVLSLPWGVEIYDLLTRWNPLRQHQFAMKPYNGNKIMIAGMGPAGFTLAHHLLMEGCAVVGFDGLKIEPLPEKYIHEPIYDFNELKESLDERLMAGFGGVAEYGITVRWDKNFLKLIYISLMRKPHFQVFGSTRFGGTVTLEDAWEMGFNHFVIAVGAGLPKALPIPGSLAPGMRQANDFLMALQLGNAAKKESLTNIQMRLPAVIIGGGLTGVDTATEAQAYYITQVEKTLSRYEKLLEVYGEEKVLEPLDAASREILAEHLAHGRAVKKERERAEQLNEEPNFIKLIREWGGVTIVYRRTMQESPAYINNHEELQKALEEGIFYLESLEPDSVDLNQFGHVETLLCHRRIRNDANEWETTTQEIKIPARSIFVATGTQPNIAYEFEHRGTFKRQGVQYQHYENINDELTIPHGVQHCKDPEFGPFTSYHKHDKRVTLIGDTHPVFHGSVVKAIASGLKTYPKIMTVLPQDQLGDEKEYQQFADKIRYQFQTTISDIKRCAENVLELTVKSPLAAKHFRAGQFYRIQNYETYSQHFDTTSLQIEPLALIAASTDSKHEQLTFYIIENGASSKICATFKKGDPLSLMGPTGVRAKIANEHETVLIVGNALSIPLLLSYGPALRAAGNHVIFVAVVNSKNEIYSKENIESATDKIIWITKDTHLIEATREQDVAIQGDFLDVLVMYAARIPLSDVDRIYLVGNSDLLRRFQEARKTILKPFLIKEPRIFGSVYSTMQCMLKGVCAQCLQWQIDPETGKRTKAVFACSWPDQPLELIDFANIDERQVQNKMQEHLSRLWVDYLLNEYKVIRV